MWELLRRTKCNSSAPWLMLGDFNETMWQTEHLLSSKRSERLMENFRNVLSDCNLFDLGFKGPCWTFNNKQEGIKNVRARLDRGVASPTWTDYFKKANMEHICSSRSDHLPLLVRFGQRKEWRPKGDKRQKIFRYEHMWERSGSLQSMIDSSWKRDGPAANLEAVIEKLASMQKELRGWAKRDFGSVLKQTVEIRNKLSMLWNAPYSVEQQKSINKCSVELDELLLREELMWRQRSRATYLREGDRNTKWFQRKATWRKKKNDITKLKDSSGVWKEEEKEIQEMTREFFRSLYEKEKEVFP